MKNRITQGDRSPYIPGHRYFSYQNKGGRIPTVLEAIERLAYQYGTEAALLATISLGLTESLTDFFPSARWQRCVVHFYRNVLSVVSEGKVREMAFMLKAIHAAEDGEAARKQAEAVVGKLKKMKLAAAAKKMEEAVCDDMTYYNFNSPHCIRIRTNNPLERLLRVIRMRTRVIGSFPDGHFALILSAARLKYVAGTKWGKRRYLCMEMLVEKGSSIARTPEGVAVQMCEKF